MPKTLQDISWKAQVRLCKRYRQLCARGKHPNQVVVAIAREWIALMWAIARHIPVTPESSVRIVADSSGHKVSHVDRKRRSPGMVYSSGA